MSSHLKQLAARIVELDGLGVEVIRLGQLLADGKWIEASGLKDKAEEWYRGGRALLERENFSGLADFDFCYRAHYPDPLDKNKTTVDWSCIWAYIYSPLTTQQHFQIQFPYFAQKIAKGTALLRSCVSEVKSRELSILGELSFVVAADEFETAHNLLQSSREETIIRASGVIARVALERHFRTVAQERNVTIIKNSATKAHPDFTDMTLSLKKADVITEVQRARLDMLYRIGNNCAHPKEVVNRNDVEDLIRDGKSFVALVV
ncbi:MAG TPA: DUF4145 domain-containing protein [Candidatus Dormibacteraeota bacterium]|nr:DUF4145 domain-containing protein [Candidatus Dormibacteraeota bacterium]